MVRIKSASALSSWATATRAEVKRAIQKASFWGLLFFFSIQTTPFLAGGIPQGAGHPGVMMNQGLSWRELYHHTSFG